MNLWDPFEKLKADHAYKASKAKAVGPLLNILETTLGKDSKWDLK